jgi:hypothetical protein
MLPELLESVMGVDVDKIDVAEIHHPNIYLYLEPELTWPTLDSDEWNGLQCCNRSRDAK